MSSLSRITEYGVHDSDIFVNCANCEALVVDQANIAKGAILASDGTDFKILAVGTDGQTLTANAASTLGVKWA
jgi:hypothetical protein